VLAARPCEFRLDEAAIPAPRDGQVLARSLFFAPEPGAGETGAVMSGETVSEVVESHDPGLRPGDLVLCRAGCQEFAVAAAGAVEKLDRDLAPVTTALGVLGTPGMTAYIGMLETGRPQPGETVVVRADAAGAAAGQIAGLRGARAVGVANGPTNCSLARDELGFDTCVDQQAPGFLRSLAAACPKGIDVYFESTGGALLPVLMPLLNPLARVPVCGPIGEGDDPDELFDRAPLLMVRILVRRLTVRGFRASDFASRRGEFLREMGRWVREGQVRYREDIMDGLEHAATAFQSLLKGDTTGSVLVRLD